MTRSTRTLLFAAAAASAVLLVRRARSGRSLRGKVVLITGGSRGLGIVLARELARKGARLVLCARDEHELEGASRELTASGAEVMTVRCDVGDAGDVSRAVSETVARLGQIDVLINNAGIIQVGPAESLGLLDYRGSFDANFWGPVQMSLAVLPGMRARRDGAIVNITSIGGAVSVPHLLAYSSAKAAALRFSEGLAAEVAKDGVRVTTVIPGLMRTGSFVNALFKGRREEELRWFASGASLPIISQSAERAARRIVRATERGETQVTLGLPAKLLRLFHALLPGFTVRALAVVNERVLPAWDGAGPDDAAEPGWANRGKFQSGALSERGNRDARRNREVPWAAPE